MSSTGLLDRIERYFSLAPEADGLTRIESVGGLVVPVGSPEWPYPARPRPGQEDAVSVEDVRAAVELQESAGLPASVEWLGDRCRGLAGVARAAGLHVEELPLLVVDDPVEILLPDEVRLYLVGADDPRLGLYQRLAALAFAAPADRPDAGAGRAGVPEVAVGDPGPAEVPPTELLRERVASGRTVMMVAVDGGEPVAIGSHQPVDVDGSEVSEVVGVATLPRFRGRGLGAGLTSALVDHARQTADLVFLSAGDDDVARVYERAGFARVGTTCVAERPSR
ncbi:GNAT family N-acetyltransferase [Modestobacter roseus]|uniref:Acetyltransferase (GNAT) family protein n=1 Tax=Modestobacter roseus TaxID=1181884 RepID=A0A562IQA9_9ACTN|nr:GNAT family N-acetyltransferase [Modestobacter roseus]MQA35389.1 GNAT family N-acetyltransferase [Modestobacter roseus]TWH72784.1 acetyltransferase (GNAT) family protein [Modestobacter roseus]